MSQFPIPRVRLARDGACQHESQTRHYLRQRRAEEGKILLRRGYWVACGLTPDHVQLLIFHPPASACRTNVICPSSVVGLPLCLLL